MCTLPSLNLSLLLSMVTSKVQPLAPWDTVAVVVTGAPSIVVFVIIMLILGADLISTESGLMANRVLLL